MKVEPSLLMKVQGSAENIFSVGRRYGRIDKIRNFKKSPRQF